MIKQDPNINKIIFSDYLIQKKIGKGSFGTVYKGVIISTNQPIALKLEKKKKDDSGLLETEACRLYLMQGEGIPKIICYGNNQTHNILIQELLGKSLEELFNLNKRKFSLKTVCSIGIQMIKRIQFIHSKYHLHRDIKPDNFMTGKDKSDDIIYMIDFGLAKKYYSSSKKQHIKFRTGKNLIGTARYCGRNAHRGYEQGRRDDIESIGYVLMYFLNGVLPWQGLKILKNEDQFEKIAEKKYNTSFEELTQGQPEEFLLYFQHCDSLGFEDEPNYEYLINLFQNVINKYCIDCLYDFDWKKNTVPSLSCLSPIKDKEEENNNKDISLLVHNNVSAIESKGEGKEENINIKNKKDVFVGEDKNNQKDVKKQFNGRVLKKNKSCNLLIRHSIIKDNLDINNDAIDINNNLNNNLKENYNDNSNKNSKNNNDNKNNIFIVNNAIAPRIQNININININNNSKKTEEENIFNKSDLNISKNKLNNHYNNIFIKKDIKKEYFFSYDENMDDMLQSNNSIQNIKIDYEKGKISKDILKKDKLARFQQPKKLENIFTEEDIKTGDIMDTCVYNNENENKKTLKNSSNNNLNNKNKKIIKNISNKNLNIIKNNNKSSKKENHNKNNENQKNIDHKEHKHHHNNNHNNDKNNDKKKDDKNEKKEENIKNDKEGKIKIITKEIIKGYKYDDIKKGEIQLKNENVQKAQNGQNELNSQNIENSQNDENKNKKRNRVKSVDNKIRKDNPACVCLIF